MANISKDLLATWKDGDTFRAGDYTKERDVIVAAVNDNDARLATMVTQTGLLQALSDNANGDHKGTWQGYSPSDFTSSSTITPASIGAASQADLDAANARINNLYAKRINLSDYPRLPGETNDIGRFNRAIADMNDGDTLIVPNDYYYAENITINKSISIVFEGNAVIESVNPNPSYILKYEGTLGTNNYILTAPANRWDRIVRLTTTPTDISAGDMIVLRDDTVRVGDSQPDVNIEVHEIVSITNSESETLSNTALNTDSNSDGVVDGWIQNKSASLTATYSLDTTESAQKIVIQSSTSSGSALIEQDNISVTPGQAYNLEVDAKVANLTGTAIGIIYVAWVDGSNNILSTSASKTFTNLDWQRIKNWNLVAPTGAVSARIYLGISAQATNDTGTVWLKNASFKKSTADLLLKDYVRLPKAVSSSQNVVKVNPLENIEIRNFKYKIKEGSTTGVGLYAWDVRNFRVVGLQADRGAESAVQFRRSMYVTVEKFSIRNPQVVGSGQGYGIQFFGGNNGVTVRDGYTWKTRHSVDFDSTFDALVENVIDYEGQQASFMITHNGWCSDITYRSVKSLQAKSSGFVCESQGVSDPYTLTQHNIQIIDCEWHRDKDPADSVGYGFGIWFKCPIMNSRVSNFRARYGDGSSYTSGQDNAAIRMLPTRNDLVIDRLVARGFRRGVYITHTSNVAETAYSNKIVLNNITVANSNVGFLINYGTGKSIILRNISCDNIIQNVFEGNSAGSYREFILDGLSLTNSSSATVFQSVPTPDSGTKLKGAIRNIRSDRGHDIPSPAAGWALTMEDILLKGNGESVLLSGTASASGSSALPNGIVEGQRLTILSSSAGTFTIQSSNILYKGGATSISLTSTNRATTLEWRNGQSWYQIV